MRRLTDAESRLWTRVARTVRPMRRPPRQRTATTAKQARNVADRQAAIEAARPAARESEPAPPPPLEDMATLLDPPRPPDRQAQDPNAAERSAPPRRASPAAGQGGAPPPADASGHRRVRRGDVSIDGSIDLHGLTHDQARAALVGFVASARSRGARCILVITGKGREGRGLLRARFPQWLEGRDIREAVAGYAPAHARHGGAGAWYLFLKSPQRGSAG